MKENTLRSAAGIPMLLALLVALLFGAYLIFNGVRSEAPMWVVAGLLVEVVAFFCCFGLYMVEPNQAAVVSLFGKYVGTVKENGLRWNNPFYTKRKVSQRVRNFESGKLKVNELDGSPIEIAAVIVWQVVDSAEAVFNVDDYESFVQIQSESALRAMATSYPYDQHEEGQLSLLATPPKSARTWRRSCPNAWPMRACRCSTRASATWPTRPRSPRRCCSASRRTRSSPRARASSPAPSAWSKWRWPSCRRTAWCTWTKNARRRWSATCSWCCAVNARRSPSSTPERSTDG